MPAPTRIHLVRHGVTDWNREGRAQGAHDVPLNEEGREQARALARAIAPLALDAAYSSPLSRARETAEILLRAQGLSVTLDDDLRELGYGTCSGLTVADWPAGVAERWKDRPSDVTFPQGESIAEVCTRLSRFWDRILTRHAGQTLLVVGHGHANRILLSHVLGWDLARFWTIRQPNAWHGMLTVSAEGTTELREMGGNGAAPGPWRG